MQLLFGVLFIAAAVVAALDLTRVSVRPATADDMRVRQACRAAPGLAAALRRVDLDRALAKCRC